MIRVPRTFALLAVAGPFTTAAVVAAMLAAPDALAAQVAGRWGQALAEGAGAAACALTARRLAGRGRLTWGLFAAGEGIWALTDLAAGAGVMAGIDPAPPSAFDIAWLAFYAPMFSGALLLYGRLRPERTWQGVLDAGLVSAALSLVGWRLLVGPAAGGASGGTLGTVVDMAYPILDLACLGALGWVIARHHRQAPRWLWWVVAAFGLGLVADVAYLLAYLHGLAPAGGLAAGAYMTAGWLWALAAERRRAAPRRAWEAGVRDAPPTWSEAIPVASGLTVAGLIAGPSGPLGLLALATLALALGRMALTYRVNRALIAERRGHEDRLRELLGEQAALTRVAEAVAGGTEPAGLFGLVAEETAALFRAEIGLVWRFDGSAAEVAGRFGEGAPSAGQRIELTGDGAAPSVARTGASARSSYPRGGGRHRHGAASPVTAGGEMWGCVHIAVTSDRAQSPFDAALTERLDRFADLVGVALANAEARMTLESRAATDPLTGLANHRFFQERLREEWERARRHHHDLSLVILDLDHFKRVNDVHGHPAGDGVLVEVARRLHQATRSRDLVGRVGGEEFAWVLPHTPLADALDAAERARALIGGAAFPGVGTLTASFGVCHASMASGPSELHQMADDALYAAKRRGRDRVCSFPLEEPAPETDPLLRPDGRRQQTARGVLGLARAVDAKDPSTRQHSGRVADLAVQLAVALGWDPVRCAALRDAGLMHDVGKIAVPDAILLKPGRLTHDEYEIVKTHAAVGAGIVADVLTAEQVAWVRHHHERIDGRGYPDRLGGDAIPAGARILALADAVDAMITPRAYAPGMTLDEALEECRRCAGGQFDARVVEAFGRLVEVGVVAPPPLLVA